MHTGASVLDFDAARAARRVVKNPEAETIEASSSPKADVIASIRIEMRRGGQISKQIEGVNAGNAQRLTSSLLRTVAEVFGLMGNTKK